MGEGGSRGSVAEGGSQEQGSGAVVNHLPDQAEAGPPHPGYDGAKVAAAEYRQQASDKNATLLFKIVKGSKKSLDVIQSNNFINGKKYRYR